MRLISSGFSGQWPLNNAKVDLDDSEPRLARGRAPSRLEQP